MKNMKPTIEQIEESLYEYAKPFSPPGTEVKAVIHQWLHAIADDNKLFASGRGATSRKVLAVLKKDKIIFEKADLVQIVSDMIHLKPQKQKFTFIDLFAGVGGMRLGFQAVGGHCVFSSEFDKHAQETYSINHGDFPFGDITKIAEEDIPDHDVLIAGFPCQPFSHAGLKLGIDDTRGTLFYDIARILINKRPKVALLENVKGLISHDKGHTLKVILGQLSSIGYKCIVTHDDIKAGDGKYIRERAREMVLKSKDFSVPQNRQRIYIVFWREDLDCEFTYPVPNGEPTRVGDILEKNPDPKYTISDKLWAGHQRRKKQNKINGKGFGFGLVNAESEYTNTISARYYKDGSEVLIEQEGKNPRKLTHREAARLQGFPDEFIYNPSSVQGYKQFGNSVSVPVIEALAKSIKGILVR